MKYVVEMGSGVMIYVVYTKHSNNVKVIVPHQFERLESWVY
jgi:hypothetical protein